MQEKENDQQEVQQSFQDLLGNTILPKVESISVIVLSIGVILKYFEIGKPDPVFGISLTTLAVTSFLQSSLTKGENLLQTVTYKVGFISCSISIVGVMYTLLSLPGNMPMLKIGTGALGVATTLLIYQILKAPTDELKKSGIRFGITLLAALFFLFQNI